MMCMMQECTCLYSCINLKQCFARAHSAFNNIAVGEEDARACKLAAFTAAIETYRKWWQ
jgi:hypothetical protein